MLNGLSESITANMGTLIIIAAILAGSYIASFFFSRLLSWYQLRFEDSGSRRLSLSMTSFARKSVNLVIYSLAFITILAQLKVQITPFLAGLGIVGIAVALAAQELLSNFFGAIAILIDRPYKTGDRIALSGGQSGDVVEIGVRSTRIKTLDNRIIIVPNAKISSSKIDNYSEPDLNLRYAMRFGIDYRSNVDKASNILIEIATGMTGVLRNPAPAAYVDGLNEFSVSLVLLVWVEDFQRDSDIPDRIYRQAIKRFAAENIDIPYPITTVRYPAVNS